MDEYRTVWTRAEGPTRILAVAVAITVLQVLAVVLLGVSSLPAALAVPLAVLLGPAAVWGVAFGAAFADLFAVGPGVEPLVSFVDLFVVGALGRALWVLLPADRRRRLRSALLAIVPVALVATAVGGGVGAVGLTVLGSGEFASIVPSILAERAVLTVLLAPIVLGLGYRWTDVEVSGPGTTVGRWIVTLAVIAAVATAWIVGTAVFSLTREDVRAIDPLHDGIVDWASGALDPAVVFALGPYGRLLHLVGIVGLLALVALALRVGRRSAVSAR